MYIYWGDDQVTRVVIFHFVTVFSFLWKKNLFFLAKLIGFLTFDVWNAGVDGWCLYTAFVVIVIVIYESYFWNIWNHYLGSLKLKMHSNTLLHTIRNSLASDFHRAAIVVSNVLRLSISKWYTFSLGLSARPKFLLHKSEDFLYWSTLSFNTKTLQVNVVKMNFDAKKNFIGQTLRPSRNLAVHVIFFTKFPRRAERVFQAIWRILYY